MVAEEMTRLLIAASGTGGHLFPALAVAEAVEDQWPFAGLAYPIGSKLSWCRSVLAWCVWTPVVCGPWAKKLVQLLRLLLASVSVRRVIRRNAIDVVFTTGGYIAAPRSWQHAGAAFP